MKINNFYDENSKEDEKQSVNNDNKTVNVEQITQTEERKIIEKTKDTCNKILNENIDLFFNIEDKENYNNKDMLKNTYNDFIDCEINKNNKQKYDNLHNVSKKNEIENKEREVNKKVDENLESECNFSVKKIQIECENVPIDLSKEIMKCDLHETKIKKEDVKKLDENTSIIKKMNEKKSESIEKNNEECNMKTENEHTKKRKIEENIQKKILQKYELEAGYQNKELDVVANKRNEENNEKKMNESPCNKSKSDFVANRIDEENNEKKTNESPCNKSDSDFVANKNNEENNEKKTNDSLNNNNDLDDNCKYYGSNYISMNDCTKNVISVDSNIEQKDLLNDYTIKHDSSNYDIINNESEFEIDKNKNLPTKDEIEDFLPFYNTFLSTKQIQDFDKLFFHDPSDSSCLMRLHKPNIPKYNIDSSLQSLVVDNFIYKIENPSYKVPFDQDLFYLSFADDTTDDIKQFIDDNAMYKRFECKELRIFDFNLIKKMKVIRREIEKATSVFARYYLNENISDENNSKVMYSIVKYVKNKKLILFRIEELRNKINKIVKKAEENWNFASKCYHIANKGCK